ncbi:MAG: hypothetical protein KBC78_01245 [Candidatus Pacebacteria bacterium]|nr:hypothetical protein [Candidatus Paceibacterota bacterium]
MDQRTNNQKNSYSETPKISRVRRFGGERINNDWAYLNEEDHDPYESTDKTFNRNYRHSGLGSDNISGEEEDFEQSQNNPNYKTRTEYRRSENNASNNRRSQEAKKAVLTAWENSKTVQKGLGLANTRKTMVVTRSIVYWAGYIWLFVQVPIALFGIVLFAIIGGFSKIGSALESNFITNALKSVVEVAGSVIGIQLGSVAEAFFFITYMFVFVIGVITVLCIFIQHSLALNRPLSGNGTGLKIGALILAFIGYATPIVNILPWALPWVLAIGKYPR